MSKGATIAVGKVVGGHGINGEIRVLPYVEKEEIDLEFFRSALKTIYIDAVHYTLKGLRCHKGALLVKFDGVNTRSQAYALKGKELFVEKECLPKLEEGEFYWFEVLGMEVFSEDNRYLGSIVNILPTGGNHVMELSGPFGEILLPLIEDVIVNMDVREKKMRVRLPEGLVKEDFRGAQR